MDKITLVIGASTNPERYSNKAIHLLKKFHHSIFALGNTIGQIDGVNIDVTLMQYKDIHTVTLYINPKIQAYYQQYIINLKPKRVIFNPGTENEMFKNQLLQHGIEVLEACTLVLLQTHQY